MKTEFVYLNFSDLIAEYYHVCIEYQVVIDNFIGYVTACHL